VAGSLLTSVPERALAIYAHPDDAEVACGGTLATWAARGTLVHQVVATSGEKGSADPRADLARLAAKRAGEVAAAGSLLGVASQELLGIPDGEVEDDLGLRRRLVAIVRALEPDVVLCPDPEALVFGGRYVNHRDHRKLGIAVLDAVAPAAASPAYFPDAGRPHPVTTVLLSASLVPDVWVDVGAGLDAKIAAARCHRTQVGEAEWLGEALRQRAAEAGRVVGVRFAEGFRRIQLVAEHRPS